jgi:hypothetical protein
VILLRKGSFPARLPGGQIIVPLCVADFSSEVRGAPALFLSSRRNAVAGVQLREGQKRLMWLRLATNRHIQVRHTAAVDPTPIITPGRVLPIKSIITNMQLAGFSSQDLAVLV